MNSDEPQKNGGVRVNSSKVNSSRKKQCAEIKRVHYSAPDCCEPDGFEVICRVGTMTLFNFIIYGLWVLPIVLQAAILLGMLRRKLVKSFPVFFAYTAWVLFSAAGLLFLKPYGNLFHHLHWGEEALSVVLGLSAIFEILRHILPPFASPRFVITLVWVFAGLFIVTALLIFVSAKPMTGNYATYEVIVLAERSVRFLQASLLIVVIALMSVLGLGWHHEALGILIGFGVYSTVALVAFECGALHWLDPVAFSMLNSAGYNIAVLIWAFYILRPRRRRPVEPLPSAGLADWNDVLDNYVNQRSRR